MSACPNCGHDLIATAKFCPNCGTKISEASGEPVQEEGLAVLAGAQSEDPLYDAAIGMIAKVSQLSIIRGNRDEFLRKQFAKSPYLDEILEYGPQAVYSPDALRKKADDVINECTTKTAAVSFVSGLPSSPLTMVAAGGADVVQYFGFAIYLAERLAYLFGEDDLFEDGSTEMPEDAKIRILAYLGVMFGAGGAAQLVKVTSEAVGKTVGKKVAAKALTKTTWYPLVKKVGALVGQKITKKTVEKTITKAVPVVGGVVSGAITFATFRPMGGRLADVFAQNLKGDFVTDGDFELSGEFAERLAAESKGTV